MAKVGYYSRAERKYQIAWCLMNAAYRFPDTKMTAAKIAHALDMAKSQHLLLIIKELEKDGVVASELEPFRGFPRRVYKLVESGVQLFYAELCKEFVEAKKKTNTIIINSSARQQVMFADWR